MKRCSNCQEDFADRYLFCPVDGTPLDRDVTSKTPVTPDVPGTRSRAAAHGYSPTVIEDAGLARRLFSELGEAARAARLSWPEFRKDPAGCAGRLVVACGQLLWRRLSSPNVAIGSVTAVCLVFTVLLAVFLIDQRRAKALALARTADQDLIIEHWVDLTAEHDPTDPDKGIGTGAGGRVGMKQGKGEGSNPQPERAGGGGGGGTGAKLAAQHGMIPPPSPIPAPIPNAPPLHQPSLAVAGSDLDPALYKDLKLLNYGVPQSVSTERSNGPGTGGGMGDGDGTGTGDGHGAGVGPGTDGNMGKGKNGPGGNGPGGGTGLHGPDHTDRPFPPHAVSQKARILSKPEPQYTEDARRNLVSGTVIIKAVFSAYGQVTNIQAVSGLPFGLTEKAVAAARQIRFEPAVKDGQKVAQYIQIEYNFNLY
jgi:TonB family protein